MSCFGPLYAHHQELESILVLLPHMVCNALVAGGRRSMQAMRPGWGKLLEQLIKIASSVPKIGHASKQLVVPVDLSSSLFAYFVMCMYFMFKHVQYSTTCLWFQCWTALSYELYSRAAYFSLSWDAGTHQLFVSMKEASFGLSQNSQFLAFCYGWEDLCVWE